MKRIDFLVTQSDLAKLYSMNRKTFNHRMKTLKISPTKTESKYKYYDYANVHNIGRKIFEKDRRKAKILLFNSVSRGCLLRTQIAFQKALSLSFKGKKVLLLDFTSWNRMHEIIKKIVPSNNHFKYDSNSRRIIFNHTQIAPGIDLCTEFNSKMSFEDKIVIKCFDLWSEMYDYILIDNDDRRNCQLMEEFGNHMTYYDILINNDYSSKRLHQCLYSYLPVLNNGGKIKVIKCLDSNSIYCKNNTWHRDNYCFADEILTDTTSKLMSVQILDLSQIKNKNYLSKINMDRNGYNILDQITHL